MAGVLLKGPLDKIKPGDWKWMLDTNLLGTVRAALAFLPHMTERGSGHIVNTVSADALTPSDPLTIAYDTGQVARTAIAMFSTPFATEAVAEAPVETTESPT